MLIVVYHKAFSIFPYRMLKYAARCSSSVARFKWFNYMISKVLTRFNANLIMFITIGDTPERVPVDNVRSPPMSRTTKSTMPGSETMLLDLEKLALLSGSAENPEPSRIIRALHVWARDHIEDQSSNIKLTAHYIMTICKLRTDVVAYTKLAQHIDATHWTETGGVATSLEIQFCNPNFQSRMSSLKTMRRS